MEPGFLKPGNARAGVPRRKWPVTSMEPGFLKPGNVQDVTGKAPTEQYFNGAGLPEARKPG